MIRNILLCFATVLVFCKDNNLTVNNNFYCVAKDGKYNCYAITTKGNKSFITTYASEPSSVQLYKSSKILSVRFNCGNPCNYTYYADLENGTVSKGFFGVLAFDSVNNRTAYVDSDFIGICRIFDTRSCQQIKRDFAPVASLLTAVKQFEFVKDGIIIRYLFGTDYEEKIDTVKLN